MKRLSFGESACEQTRKYLDSYISNELLVETNHEVLRHLAVCPACATEADAGAKLRARLRAAVRAQPAPPELAALVRQQIQAGESKLWRFATWSGLPFAAAAASVVLVAFLWITRPAGLPSIADHASHDAYIQNVSSRVASVFRIGLRDHIHCALLRRHSTTPLTVEKMEQDIGPSFKGMLPAVRAAVPDGYHIVSAHRCAYLKRKYVHLAMVRGDSTLSLVIASKQDGESFHHLLATPGPAGIPIYQSGADRYQIAAFDAGNFLAFVISDLKSTANLKVASTLAPGVNDFLRKAGA